MSTLGALKVLRVRELHVPPAGGFYADLSLDASSLPAIGPATLTIGDLSLAGMITISQMDDHPSGGAQPRVVLEGGAGWSKILPRGGLYSQPGGVRLSTVLRDLAALSGEAYDAPPDVLLPPDYRWPASTAREPVTGRDVLSDLMTRGAIPTWRVDPATGHTVFTPWPSIGASDQSGRVLRRSLARGRRTVGLDTRVAAFLPGSTLEGVPTRRMILTETAGKLQVDVYSAEAPAPLAMLRQIVVSLFPWFDAFRASSDKGLSVLTEARRLHLEGDAGDPAVVRVGDLVCRFYFMYAGAASVLWVSTSTSAPYAWAPIAGVATVPPTPADAGTAITTTTGSTRVTSG